MAVLLYEFKVVEHYEEEAPEDFGFVHLDHIPVPGEIVQLYWLDRRPAYQVEVISADEEELRLDVKKKPD